MVAHMKTTIEIADSLLEEARAKATREGTTLRAVVEEGLRAVLGRQDAAAPADFELLVFDGGGSWPPGVTATELVDQTYEDHARKRFPELFGDGGAGEGE